MKLRSTRFGAIGGSWRLSVVRTLRLGHDGPKAVPEHQPLNPAAARRVPEPVARHGPAGYHSVHGCPGRECLPSSIVGFFHGAFRPNLDQMEHAPISNLARYRL